MGFAQLRFRRFASVAIAVALSTAINSGCGSSCDAQKAECSNECRRIYQVCHLHGNEEFYCHNQAALCYENCGYNRQTCKEPLSHFW